MFFSWFSKNKHFNKKKGISGQIMPFLLVIIAIFLGAAMTVVKLGRDVINITCTENAMDDCSLDAASIWSQALNEMMASNEEWKTEYEAWFAEDIQRRLAERANKLDEAENGLQEIKDLIGSSNYGRVTIEPFCEEWDAAQLAAGRLNAASMVASVQATIFMDEITKMAAEVAMSVEQEKMVQQAAYYGFREGFAEAHAAAQEAGATIAQLNIEECLIQYPDGSTETDGGITGESYTTTSVYVPNISAYQLQVAPRSKPCSFIASIASNPPELAGCDYPMISLPPPPEGGEEPEAPDIMGNLQNLLGAVFWGQELPPIGGPVPEEPAIPPLNEQMGIEDQYMLPYALQTTAEIGMGLQQISTLLQCASDEMADIFWRTIGSPPPGDCCPATGSVYQDSKGCPNQEDSWYEIGTAGVGQVNLLKYSTEWWEALRRRAAKVMEDVTRILNMLNIYADITEQLKIHNQKIMDAFDPANKKVISSTSGGEQNGLYDGWTGDGFMTAPSGAPVPPIIPGTGDTGDTIIIGIDSLTFEPGCISCSGGGQSSGAGYGGGSMADDGTGSYTPGLSDYCPSAEWGSGGTSGTATDGACVGP